MSPFFSICIPVYKNVVFLKRLLDSVLAQTFTDFEIIITDDSPDETVQQWLATHFEDARIHYFRNPTALGTPENWNEGIRKASGEWIKLIHDDDWLETPETLQTFAQAIQQHPGKVYFSAYRNHFLTSNRSELVRCPPLRWKMVQANPAILHARNIIGPPSVILVHRSISEMYDKRMKWLVDIDYYNRVMQQHPFYYIDQPLIAVGIGDEQVTVSCHAVPEVEIPEGLLMLSKLAGKPWRNPVYFDAWWRIVRNLNIWSEEQFSSYANGQDVPQFIRNIIQRQKNIAPTTLQNGYQSKILMLLCWLKNR